MKHELIHVMMLHQRQMATVLEILV